MGQAHFPAEQASQKLLRQDILGGILVGGDAIQISMGLPAAAISLFNGILLLSLMAGEFFLRYRPRWRRA